MKIQDFNVERWMDAYETKCELNLSESCVDSLSVRELVNLCGKEDEFMEDILKMKLTYGSIEGSDYLKRGITGLYQKVMPDQITVTHGTIAANYLVLMSLIEPSDEVITVLPTYQQHYSVPESIGAKVHKIRAVPEKGFLPDLDEMRKLTNSRTKMITFVNPNNPTGAAMDENMLKQIAEIAGAVDAYVLSDEAYRGMNHTGSRFTASIADLYGKGISTGSMSKTFSLAGLRTGWICGPKKVIETINTRRDYTHISCPMIDDYLAAIALEQKDKIIDRSLNIIRENIKIIDSWIENNPGFSYIKPKAGSVTIMKYDLNMASVDFCRQLLDRTGVLVIPGSMLDIEGYFRIGIGNNSETLKKGLDKISGFYKNLCKL